MNKRKFSHIGSISLGTVLEMPTDISVVGLQLAQRENDENDRDVSYILMTGISLAELRSLYKRKWTGIDIRWVVDKPEMFSFTAFKPKGQYKKDAFIFSLSAFNGLSDQEGRVLGLSEGEWRRKTFIFLILREPPAEGGLITLPLVLKP